MNCKQTWGIIGLGWLGEQLAQHLTAHKISYWGTTTADFNWLTDEFPSQPSEVLVLNTPPLSELAPREYVNKLPLGFCGRILFISSTSVYGELTGDIDETSLPEPQTENAKWLRSVEELLVARYAKQVVIIRSGGLIGPGRHPVHRLAASSKVIAGLAPVNLIDSADLVRIILTCAQAEQLPQILNAVSPYHPRKKEYFSRWAAQLGLAPLNFLSHGGDQKIIHSKVLPALYTDWVNLNLDGS